MLKKMISFIALSLSIALIGCAAKETQTEYAADKVVARSDDRSSRPDWARETKTVMDEGGHWVILGVVEVPGDSRAQAAFKMSDANARGNLSQKIETSVLKIVEASDTGLSMEDQSLKSLVREISQTSFKNIDIDDRYWEKVIRTKSTAEEVMVMKAFSRVKISKSDFTKLLADHAERSKAAPKEIKDKVESLIEKNLESQFGNDVQ